MPVAVLLIAVAYVLLSLAAVAGIGVWSYLTPSKTDARTARSIVMLISLSQAAVLGGAIGYAVCFLLKTGGAS